METQSTRFSNGELVFRLFVVKTKRPMTLVSFCLALLLLSCNINPNLQEVSQLTNNPAHVESSALSSASFLPGTVSLNRVDLFLAKENTTTGSVLVEIRDSQTGVTVGSTSLPVSDLTKYGWTTFTFTPALQLIRGNKYKIHLIRSDEHNHLTGNTLFWRTSSIGVDAYPDGLPLGIDFMFKTYTNGGIDQQQTSNGYAYAIGTIGALFQEFKADYPRVSVNRIDLNLLVGTAATGNITVEIREADGITVLAQNVMRTSQIPPSFLLIQWVTFNFNTILYRDQPYRIYVTRSDLPSSSAGDIYWRTSSIGTDPYPVGSNDVFPSLTLDYAFRTYSVSGIDQYQNLNTYGGIFLSHNVPHFQEFVPRRQ